MKASHLATLTFWERLAAYVISGLNDDEPASMALERLYHSASYGEAE